MPGAFNRLGIGAGLQGCISGVAMSVPLSPSVLKCLVTGDMGGVQGLR